MDVNLSLLHGFPLTEAARAAGERFQPSNQREKGRRMNMERIVMMENREIESIPSFFSMSFLLRTLRLWKVRLDPLRY